MKVIFNRIVFIVTALALFLDGLAVVDFALHPFAPDYNFHLPFFRSFTILVLLPLTLLIGFLIIRRVPGNMVGPLLIVWSGSVAFNSIREDIGAVLFALYYGFNLVFGWTALFLMFLHFPDGIISSPRAARWIYRLLGLIVLSNLLIFISTNPLQTPSGATNPFYLPALGRFPGLILGLGLLLTLPILVLIPVSAVQRYRNGSLLQRQQIKWLALLASSIVIYTILGLIVYPLLTGGQIMNPGSGLIGILFFAITGLFPPVAIGVAVLRYHLWDIDLIIRRTLVYSTLTIILTLIYFGSVVVLQNLFAFILKLAANDLAIVLSTLMIAALFTPLRRRIQTNIDRRFFRKKYNADQILARFAATTRVEVTLETLAAALLSNVEETIQPEQMNLWLKAPQSKLIPPEHKFLS